MNKSHIIFFVVAVVCALALVFAGHPIPQVSVPSYFCRILQAGLPSENVAYDPNVHWSKTLHGLMVTSFNPQGKYKTVVIQGDSLQSLALRCKEKFKTLPKSFRTLDCRLQLDFITKQKKRRNPFSSFDPGLNGLLVIRESEVLAWFLPSEALIQDCVPSRRMDKKKTLILLNERIPVDASTKDADYYRITTKSFIQSKAGVPEFVSLHRGNVLWTDDVKPQEIYQSCVAAGDYFVKTIDDNGMFAYNYYPVQQTIDNNSYNHLRHCGCVYSMFELYKINKSEALLDAGVRALNYILDFVPERAEGETFRFVKSIPRKNGTFKVKLGGSGLLLLALCEYETATGDTQYRSLMQDLYQFMRSMQKPNGDFFAKFDAETRSGIEDSFSIYYPGEAALSMLRLYAITGDAEILDTVSKALYFLRSEDHKQHPEYRSIVRKVGYPGILIDSWRMMAFYEMFEYSKEAVFAEECLVLGEAMLIHQYNSDDSVSPDFVGGPRFRLPKVISSGSRKEGLAAAYRVAELMGNDTVRYRRALLDSTKFCMQQQYRPVNSYFLPDDTALGGIRNGLLGTVIRNDSVQHNLSGMIALLKILNEYGD